MLKLEHGLKLLKIDTYVTFYQSAWLKPYIDLNTKIRIESDKKGDSFGVDFYKLMINSVFGKIIENKQKYRDIRLVTNEKVLRKYSSR